LLSIGDYGKKCEKQCPNMDDGYDGGKKCEKQCPNMDDGYDGGKKCEKVLGGGRGLTIS
jgi:hypothetical protein